MSNKVAIVTDSTAYLPDNLLKQYNISVTPLSVIWGETVFRDVFFFSLGYRLFARRADFVGVWISPLAALVIGLAGVVGTNALIVFGVVPDLRNKVIFGTLAAALLMILILWPTFDIPTPSLVFWVPFLTHIYTLIAGLISGVILDPPFLLCTSLAMFGVALYLHRTTVRSILFKNTTG